MRVYTRTCMCVRVCVCACACACACVYVCRHVCVCMLFVNIKGVRAKVSTMICPWCVACCLFMRGGGWGPLVVVGCVCVYICACICVCVCVCICICVCVCVCVCVRVIVCVCVMSVTDFWNVEHRGIFLRARAYLLALIQIFFQKFLCKMITPSRNI